MFLLVKLLEIQRRVDVTNIIDVIILSDAIINRL